MSIVLGGSYYQWNTGHQKHVRIKSSYGGPQSQQDHILDLHQPCIVAKFVPGLFVRIFEDLQILHVSKFIDDRQVDVVIHLPHTLLLPIHVTNEVIMLATDQATIIRIFTHNWTSQEWPCPALSHQITSMSWLALSMGERECPALIIASDTGLSNSEYSEDHKTWSTTPLKVSGLRAFLSRMSEKEAVVCTGGVVTHQLAATQSNRLPLVLSLSRDGKLRVWDLIHSSCVWTEALFDDTDGSSLRDGNHSLKTFDLPGAGLAHWQSLVVINLNSSGLFILGIAWDAEGHVQSLKQLLKIDQAPLNFVDYSLTHIESRQGWTSWSLGLLVPESPCFAIHSSTITLPTLTTSNKNPQVSSWIAKYPIAWPQMSAEDWDERVASYDGQQDLSTIFLDYILSPIQSFSLHSIRQALAEYRHLSGQKPLNQPQHNLRDNIADSIHHVVDSKSTSGAADTSIDQSFDMLDSRSINDTSINNRIAFREWLRFSSLLMERHLAACIPVGFLSGQDYVACAERIAASTLLQPSPILMTQTGMDQKTMRSCENALRALIRGDSAFAISDILHDISRQLSLPVGGDPTPALDFVTQNSASLNASEYILPSNWVDSLHSQNLIQAVDQTHDHLLLGLVELARSNDCTDTIDALWPQFTQVSFIKWLSNQYFPSPVSDLEARLDEFKLESMDPEFMNDQSLFAQLYRCGVAMVQDHHIAYSERSFVEAGCKLLQLKAYKSALQWSQIGPRSNASDYIEFLCILYDSELRQEDRVAALINTFANAPLLPMGDPLFSFCYDQIKHDTLPRSRTELLLQCYKDIVSSPGLQSVQSAIDCLTMCLSAASAEPLRNGASTNDLWQELCRIQLDQGHLEEAFHSITNMSDTPSQNDAISRWITCVAANQPTLLIHTPFADLRGRVEFFLSQKVCTADPSAEFNYFDISIGYWTVRSEWKRAASIALLKVNRLCALPVPSDDDFYDRMAIISAAYLIGISSLSLIRDQKDQWIVVDDTNRNPNRVDSIFEDFAAKSSKILILADIKRQYARHVARLHLSSYYPQLTHSTSLMAIDDVMALFVGQRLFEAAFKFAKDVEAGYDILIRAFLAAISENRNELVVEDSIMQRQAMDNFEKQWLYLQRHIENDSRSMETVSECIDELGCAIPEWVLKWFKQNYPDALLRVLTKSNPQMAIEISTQLLRSGSLALLTDKTESHVNYTLLNGLLKSDASEFHKEKLLECVEQRQKVFTRV